MSQAVVFGVTGFAGGKIASELVERGHKVTGVARHVASLPEGVTARSGSIFDAGFVAEATEGVDEIEQSAHSRQRFTVAY